MTLRIEQVYNKISYEERTCLKEDLEDMKKRLDVKEENIDKNEEVETIDKKVPVPACVQ